jgi:hypothetical protein
MGAESARTLRHRMKKSDVFSEWDGLNWAKSQFTAQPGVAIAGE